MFRRWDQVRSRNAFMASCRMSCNAQVSHSAKPMPMQFSRATSRLRSTQTGNLHALLCCSNHAMVGARSGREISYRSTRDRVRKMSSGLLPGHALNNCASSGTKADSLNNPSQQDEAPAPIRLRCGATCGESTSGFAGIMLSTLVRPPHQGNVMFFIHSQLVPTISQRLLGI